LENTSKQNNGFLSWFKYKPDKKLEDFYFETISSEKHIFFPWGRSRQAYEINQKEKKQFNQFKSYLLILFFILIPLILIFSELTSPLVTWVIILAILMNTRLILMWIYPYLFTQIKKLKAIEIKKDKDNLLKYTIITILIQVILIMSGVFFGHNQMFGHDLVFHGLLVTFGILIAYPFLLFLSYLLFRKKRI